MRMRPWFTALSAATVMFVAVACPDAYAWGNKGHRLIGHVAQALLSSDTRARITALMGSDDVASFALYLDQHKVDLAQRIPGSRNWHFDDVPVCETNSHEAYCPHGDCASTQLSKYAQVLGDTHASTQEQRFAIFVVTHLVGDVHQPLHAADNHDRGGNGVRVTLPDGRTLNLHAAWDAAFVEAKYRGQHERTVARDLVERFATQAKEQAWRTTKPADWINESHAIAATFVYRDLDGFRCGADMGARRIELSTAYATMAEAVVDEQLAKAGYRLAELLNRAFGN